MSKNMKPNDLRLVMGSGHIEKVEVPSFLKKKRGIISWTRSAIAALLLGTATLLPQFHGSRADESPAPQMPDKPYSSAASSDVAPILTEEYMAREGDTVSDIVASRMPAGTKYTEISAILDSSGLSNRDKLTPGEVLVLTRQGDTVLRVERK
jgi:hypothetical protein